MGAHYKNFIAGEWVDGATTATVGARFRGRNRAGRFNWSRVNEVIAIDAPREIAWRTVTSPIYRDSTEWRIRVEPHERGTRIAIQPSGDSHDVQSLARN